MAALACCALTAYGSEASTAAKQARKAEKKDEISKAYLLYKQASTLAPGNRKYRAKAANLETRAALSSKVEPTAGDPEPFIDPAEVFDSVTAKDYAAERQPAPLVELRARGGRFDLVLQGTYQSLWTQVARIYGIDAVFDSDYESGRTLHLELQQADYREAFHSLELATGAFVTPISPTVVIIAKDSVAKRNDLEQNITVSVPVPQATTTQELIEIAQAVRQTLDLQKLAWDTKTNTIVIRDRMSRAIPAQAVLENLLNYRPQVIVELQLIEVRKSEMVSYGLNLPNMINVAFTGSLSGTRSVTSTVAGSLPANTNNPFPFGSRSYQYIAQASATATNILQMGYRGLYPNSLSLFSLSVSEAQALANFSDSRSKTMLKAELRASDAQAATFHLGDKYPIVTSSFQAGLSTQQRGITPVPAFTFEDLGISLKLTPHIHGTEEISMEIESEFKLLTGQLVNGNPVISSRKMNAAVRLRDDEWGLVAGLVSRSDSRETSGTIGLSNIPLLGRLFRTHTKQKDDNELLILMKPRLVNLPGVESVTRAIRVGTETHPFIPF